MNQRESIEIIKLYEEITENKKKNNYTGSNTRAYKDIC